MGRSVKKGPNVNPKLLKKIQEMNKAGEKRVIRHGQGSPQFS